MQAELRPRQLLEQLVERAEAAGQRREAVRELGHQRLALVQRADHVQLGQAAVRELAVDERLRDHADHLAAGRERPFGDGAHQTDAAAAVDDADPAGGCGGAERACRVGVRRRPSAGGAAENADPPHGTSVPAFSTVAACHARSSWPTSRPSGPTTPPSAART